MGKAIKWAWRHFALEADVYDTLDEAIEAAVYASDYGSEALDCIEHEGERITEASEQYEAVERRILDEHMAWHRRDRTTPTHRIQARHPDGKWVTLYAVTPPISDALAEELAEFVEALGEDRVRVVGVAD